MSRKQGSGFVFAQQSFEESWNQGKAFTLILCMMCDFYTVCWTGSQARVLQCLFVLMKFSF